MKSKLFRLGWRDLLKGGYVAIITAGLTSLAQMFSAHAFSWADLGYAVGAATAAYLVKNLITNSEDKILKREEP